MPAEDTRALLQDALIKLRSLRSEVNTLRQARTEPIAIVGAGCRFPGGADSPEAFWRILRDGVDTVREVPGDRWDVDAFHSSDPGAPGKMYVREGAFLDSIDTFDAAFFGIPPREAVRMDPQQRLLLEVAWEGLERAGIAPDSLGGVSTGVYIGVMSNDYAMRQAHGLEANRIDPYMLSGNELSFAAGRLAHQLGLQGPAMAIATACSSSLVTIHLACQALRAGECDLALAGGVNVIIDPVTGVMLCKLRALSTDGRCKTFDDSADGYGRGEGAAVLVLEKLSTARARGARILAVIRGSAVNHDGHSAGLTVPNGTAQQKLLRRAFDASGISPTDLDYVEAHGTGTQLGDPVELRALAGAVGGNRSRELLVGSVKTNIGHLEAAAGVAGVLKTALALAHREIPPHLHFRNPSSHVTWRDLPLRVVAQRTPWPDTGRPGLAGVSSFGLSGVNAHVVIEEAPAVDVQQPDTDRVCVLPLSARTPVALQALIRLYDDYLSGSKESWANICYTAATGRAHFEYRHAIAARSVKEARTRLFLKAEEGLPARYVRGEHIDWAAEFSDSRPRLVDLPTYPFQRERYWVLGSDSLPMGTTEPAITRAEDLPLVDALAAQVAKTLGLPAAADPNRSLLDLGLDSLMAAEVQAWIRARYGADTPLDVLLSGASLLQVAAMIGDSSAPPATDDCLTPEEDCYPLSQGQAALWFIHTSDPESAAYNVGIALRIEAELDTEALERTLQSLVQRHPLLRTVIASVAGEPQQLIREHVAISLVRSDATALSNEELVAAVANVHRRPFDLASGPLVRVHLFTVGPAEHVLLLSLHHIICDALSVWTMLEELQSLYAAERSGGRALLDKPRVSYAAFVSWQREMLAGPEGTRLWDYWRKRLAGELPTLDLPIDFTRPAVMALDGSSCTLRISETLTASLRNLARDHHATLHNTLLAAWSVLLHRYSGQSDLIIGCATSGRPREFDGVVGYFTNPAPIRVDLSETPQFSTLLAQIRRSTLEAMDHQQMPFALLVQRLQARRDPSRSPIFQADFALLKRPPAYRRGVGTGIPFEPFELAEEEGQFDLSLHITEEEQTLSAAFKYNTALFLHTTVETIAACFLELLNGIVANPRSTVDRLPCLPEHARTRVLALGAGPAVSDSGQSVCQMFEEHARASPNAIAAEMFGSPDRLTYGELNTRANQLAHRLQSLGIGPESLVGVCLERSLDLVVAILAVLKAGGSYVPLDPSYPAQRLGFMVKDAGIRIVVTITAFIDRVPDVEAVRLDDPWPDTPQENPAPKTTSANAAYVIYTSGSTGTPKGVVCTHGGLANYVTWANQAYRMDTGTGAPVSSSIGFDATITSFLCPLAAGKTVTLLPEEGMIEALAECLRQTTRPFSLIKITPAHLELLSRLMAPEDCARRANVFVIGGEALRGDMLAYWQKHAPGTRLINEYGPTETVVGCCVYEAADEYAGSVPIGRPIANTQLYILDANRQPVPPGVTGELYIGGAGVARHYLNRSELTAQRFVADPFSGRDGARLYATGDLVRLFPDGNLDFLGRRDSQVKIRGFRIELGEIESLLGQHPSVLQALVMTIGEPASQRLIAYVTGSGTKPDPAELRRYLSERLPDHMIPGIILPLDEFPLTPHGKVDRTALPSPETAHLSTRFVSPRDSLELKVAAIWEHVLGIRQIGVHDNFFDIGGHSLLAVRLMTQLQQDLGRSLPLSALLRGPTVEQIADALRRIAPATPNSCLVPIQSAGLQPPVYCVPGAGGNVIYLSNLARHLGPDQPFYGLQAVGFDGEAPAQTSVEEMAVHYIAALRAFQPHGPYFLGGHSLGGWVAYEMAQRLIRVGEDVPLVAIIDTAVPPTGPSRDTSDWDEARWIYELARRIGELLNPDLDLTVDALRAFLPEQQLDHFKQALSGAGLFPGDAGTDYLRNVLNLFKAHSQIRYNLPRKPLPVRIALLRTSQDPAGLAANAGPSWGWSDVADVDVHIVPGEHLSALRPPHVRVLADRFAASLAEARRVAGRKVEACLPR
jgi:amino acid adenylation domain-containing protein